MARTSLRAVAVQFKRNGYRSFSGYLSSAKKEHIRLGGDSGLLMNQETAEAEALTPRGPPLKVQTARKRTYRSRAC